MDNKSNSSSDDSSTNNDRQALNQIRKQELAFIRKLYASGFFVKKMDEDGNCLYRAISDQLYGTPNYYKEIRNVCATYLEIEQNYFKSFTTDPFNFSQYIKDTRINGTWGGNIEQQAQSEIYNIKLDIFVFSEEPINTFNEDCVSDYDKARLFYRKKNHYDSIKPKVLSKISIKKQEAINSGIIKVKYGVIEKESLELAKGRLANNNESVEIKNTRLKFERKCMIIYGFFIKKIGKKNLEEALIESQYTLNKDYNTQEAQVIEDSMKEFNDTEIGMIEKEIMDIELRNMEMENMNKQTKEIQEIKDQQISEEEMLEKALKESMGVSFFL